MSKTRALVVFARPPVAGRVKSRLQPALSAEEGLELYRAMLADTLERMGKICQGMAEPFLSWSEPHRAGPELASPARGFTFEKQSGDDLGERMARTLQMRQKAGFHQVLFVGADSPNLPLEYVRRAFDDLDSLEVVVGPAADGGYYLLGCSRMHPSLFQGMPWGTAKLLDVTRQRIKSSKIRAGELPPWYDVDTPDDVARLWHDLQHMAAKGSPDLPRRTFEVLSRLLPGHPDLLSRS